MTKIGDGLVKKKIFSILVTFVLILSSLILIVSIQPENSQAASVDHIVGNLDIMMYTDYGRILQPLTTGGGTYQTARDGIGFSFIGLVIDQDNYVHTPGAENIAECYNVWPYATIEDFDPVNPISFLINDGITQKSYATFQNKGVGTGDPDDLIINQTTWTVKGKDWAIIQWTLSNLKPVPITGIALGLEIPISKVGASGGGGPGGDSGDDVDGYNAASSTYWAQDDTGFTMGFSSAIVSDPITHYYSEDYQADYMSQYINFYSDETWLYNRLHAPSQTATNGVNPGNITTTVGWDGFDLPVGASKTVSLVIAVNNSFNTMKNAVLDAQNYYQYMATGVSLTEFSDSGSASPQIEVYNYGRPPVDVSTLSLSADSGPLTGSWSVDPIPTYGYSVLTVNENIDTQGDTIDLYENANFVDSVSFGQKGPVPDPLDSESVARYFDPGRMGYVDYWLRNASSGPSWGAQNDVPGIILSSSLILDEIMFNPTTPAAGYIVIMNTHTLSSINLRNYQLVGNSLFKFPDFDMWLGPRERGIINYTIAPTLFQNLLTSGDNVYLYNNNDRLLDMMGWSTPHLIGMSARRDPVGTGTNRGYDDPSSILAGWVFDTPNQVIITEIADSDSTVSQVEIYNPTYPLIEFNIGFSIDSQSSGTLAGSWSNPTVLIGEYAVFDISTPSGLNSDGDIVRLYQNGYLLEEIYYGTYGLAPDPISDESIQRFWDGTGYTDFWSRNWTTGPNFGAQSDIPNVNSSSAIVLNEVLFNPTVVNDYFVEIYNRFSFAVDLSGYKLVCDTEYIIPPGSIVDGNTSFFYLLYSMDPSFFNPNMNANGDNVYLYDRNGSLVDMVGWNTLHTLGTSVCRVPDGNGTRDGFDDASSILAEWQFDCTPTIRLIKIDVTDGNDTFGFGDFGDYVTFNMTVWNTQLLSDIVSILYTTQEGWVVEILDESGLIVISDLNLAPNEKKNFTVRIKIPDTFNFIVEDNVTIIIQSSNSGVIRDEILLTAKIYPFVELYKSADPLLINIEGTGLNEETTLTLAAKGSGAVMEGKMSNAADIIFVVDDTGSMSPYLTSMKQEIQNIVAVFLDEIVSVRLGLISYKDNADWDLRLTFNETDFIDAVNLLTSSGGGGWEEDVYGGLDLAINDGKWRNGSVTKIIILIGDAPDHPPYDDCDVLVRNAKIDMFGIYTNAIACGPDATTISTFQSIADNGSGIFYNYQGFMDPGALAQAIIDSVLTFVPRIDVAAWDMNVMDGNPMIRDVLPPYIHYVPGSASIPPDIITVDGFGNTILEWNMTDIKIGENWTVSFNVTSSQAGMQLANVVVDSRISFAMWNKTNTSIMFPEVWIDVFALPPPPKPPLPPNPKVTVISGTDHTKLEWVPPMVTTNDIAYYLIYRAEGDPRAFDFSNPWVNTLTDIDPLGLDTQGLRTTWNFTDDVTAAQEIYYCIQSVDNISQRSISSLTVGKWTTFFSAGVSTFSIPLEPYIPKMADSYLSDMGATYIKWMDPSTLEWKQHGDGEINDIQLKQGEGYEVKFANDTTYTFCGLPAAMIIKNPGSFAGFDWASNSATISANTNPAGDITVIWEEPTLGMDFDDYFNVYRSTTRDGFHKGTATFMTKLSFGILFWKDFGAALPGTQYYYMIIPENEIGVNGTSTYSIGVWTEEYIGGHDTIGIPVKPITLETVDKYLNDIPAAVGINYYIFTGQRWGWHSTIMPEGAFDPLLEMVKGYQISTTSVTRYTFIGV
jgi:hypothetical protein